MKFVIVIVLLLIIASLFSALFFMFQDQSKKRRMANALTLRIALSLGLIAFLVIGYYLGWIQPHGLQP